MTKGWICPICGRGVAPNVTVCPCQEESTNPWPTIPRDLDVPFAPTEYERIYSDGTADPVRRRFKVT